MIEKIKKTLVILMTAVSVAAYAHEEEEFSDSLYILDEVVISSVRHTTQKSQVPSLVNVLNIRAFENTGASCMADALSYTPGLQVSTSCNNCGKVEAKINGLDGNYTAIMMDSQPLSGGGGDSYSLEQIPENMIERIEVVRGGGSSIYGASAVGGVINIITRKPQKNGGSVSHTINVMSKGKLDNITMGNIDLVTKNGKHGVTAYAQNRERQGYDHNGDGYTELTSLETTTIGMRAFLTLGNGSLNAHIFRISDKRRGGNELNKEPHEANIAEQTKHKNYGGNLSYSWKSEDGKNDLTVMTALRATNLDSYYGGILGGSEDEIESALDGYGKTKDRTIDIQGQYCHHFGTTTNFPSYLTTGIQLNMDKLNDKAGQSETEYEQKILTGGVFVQNEWKNDNFSLLVGLRIDKDNVLSKAVVNPRASLRFLADNGFNVRLSYAKGYRSPRLYDDDIHESLIDGMRMKIKIGKGLKEEKSHAFSLSAGYNGKIIGITIEGFYTRLKDCFAESVSEVSGSLISLRTNADGARVWGTNMELGLMPLRGMNIQIGMTAQEGRYDKPTKWSETANPEKRMLKMPRILGYISADYRFCHHWEIGITGRLSGKMLVPHCESSGTDTDILIESPVFGELGCRASYTWCLPRDIDLILTLGGKNLTGCYQKDLDKGYNRDSEYIYGPSQPRTGYAKLGLIF